MIIAQEKRKSNISEYILYMWQIEDLIRALDFDMDKIEKTIVSQFKTDENTRSKILDWYTNLVKMMEKEFIKKNGHLQFIVNLTNELNRFHIALLESNEDLDYNKRFQTAKSAIEEFKVKSRMKDASDIYAALQSLYSIMLLHLMKKEISKDTAEAIKQISHFLAHLSARFKQNEEGDLNIEF